MHLSRICIQNFRNFSDFEVALSGNVVVVVRDCREVHELARQPRALHSGSPSHRVDVRDAEMADEEVRGGVVAELNHRNDELAHREALPVRSLRHKIRAADELAAMKRYLFG